MELRVSIGDEENLFSLHHAYIGCSLHEDYSCRILGILLLYQCGSTLALDPSPKVLLSLDAPLTRVVDLAAAIVPPTVLLPPTVIPPTIIPSTVTVISPCSR